MDSGTVSLYELEIVGYAAVLPGNRGPALVPPVFRLKSDPARCFVPPFRVAGRWLLGPQPATWEWVRERAGATIPNFTFLDGPPFPAVADYELWVDEQGAVRYDPIDEARLRMRHLRADGLRDCARLLREGKVAEARQAAEIAMAADTGSWEPLAHLAACDLALGNPATPGYYLGLADKEAHDPERTRAEAARLVESVPASWWSEGRSYEEVCRAAESCTVHLSQRFDVPRALLRFLGSVLLDAVAELEPSRDLCSVRCSGSDAEFMSEFVRLFGFNSLSSAPEKDVVSSVLTKYRRDKGRRLTSVSASPRSIGAYFGRLELANSNEVVGPPLHLRTPGTFR